MKTIPHLLMYVAILLLSATKLIAQNNPYFFENFGIQNGLSQSSITYSETDKKGYLWFATQDGLNRYDGYNFKIFRPDFENPENSISPGIINTICADMNGAIAIGFISEGLTIYDQAKNKFHHFKNNPENKNSIAGSSVFKISIHQNNKYLVVHDNGFSFLTFPIANNYDSVIVENSKTLLGKELSYYFVNSFNFLTDADKNAILFMDNEVYFFDKSYTDFGKSLSDQLQPKSFKFRTKDDGVLQIGTDRNYNIWVLYKDKLEKIIDFASNTKITYRFRKNYEFKDRFLFFIGSDSCMYLQQSNISGMTSVNLLNENTVHIKHDPSDAKSLYANTISNLLEDKSGNLWFGTDQGISKYNPRKNKFRHIAADVKNKNWLNEPWPFSFSEDKYGNIWIGTYQANYISIFNKKTNTFENIPIKVQPPIDGIRSVMALFKDKDGQMWAGTHGNGLYKYNENTKTFKSYTFNPKDENSISGNHITSIKQDKNGFLWISTVTGLNKFDIKTEKFTRFYVSEPAISSNYDNNIRSVIMAKDGTIWFGSVRKGLIKLIFDANGKPIYKTYTNIPNDSTSLSLNQIFSISEDVAGNIWVSTAGGGLNKFNPKTEKFTRYSVKNGFPNNTVYGTLQDNQGRIWASTNYGIAMIDEKNNKITNYTVNHGLQSNEFNQGAYFKDSEGIMYFGGVNGFNYFFPSDIKLDTSSSEVVFTDFKLFNKSIVPGEKSILKSNISYTDEIVLNYWQRDFTFEFTSTNYSSPTDNQYAYMIENYHTDWVQLGTNHSISFTGFPHGDYVLKVKAANADGYWSNNYTSIKLIIKPPFWKTTWFTVLMIILLIAIVLLFIRFRTRKLIEAKKILEEKVKERTAEIEKQKNQILEKNEELNQLNEEISAQRDNLQEFNEELRTKNEEIKLQKDIIEQKNTNITSSILYAKRIQKAVLPSPKILENYFSSYFILLKPRDIVSGDFYFTKQEHNYLFVAAADCTGHGVPGAFMCMLGITMLNEIIRNKEITKASQVLNILRENIKTSLQQSGANREQQDGMDMALCVINTENMQMSFAGAYNPCWIVRKIDNGELKMENEKNELSSNNYQLTILEADHQPVGIYTKEKEFTENTFQLQKNDTFYIFSDGYHSQFGGEKNEKYKVGRFKTLITSQCCQEFHQQKEILEREFEQWKNTKDQTDDVLIVGIKV